MKYPEELKYTKSHEWVRIVKDEVTVGISDYAQDEINDVVFVELPEAGADLEVGGAMVVVESVKAAFDVDAPVKGKVLATNQELADNPGLINQDPYGGGWLVKITMAEPPASDELLSAAEYKRFLEEEKSG